MKSYVGILGATGAVGREMMKILAERSFPVGGAAAACQPPAARARAALERPRRHDQ